MLFTDDIVLVDASREYVNTKLERWREASTSKGFKISRTKIEYLNCNFSRDVLRTETPIRIEAQEYPRRDSFLSFS